MGRRHAWLASLLFTLILELLSDAVSQDQNIREINTKNIFDSYGDLYRKSIKMANHIKQNQSLAVKTKCIKICYQSKYSYGVDGGMVVGDNQIILK